MTKLERMKNLIKPYVQKEEVRPYRDIEQAIVYGLCPIDVLVCSKRKDIMYTCDKCWNQEVTDNALSL